MIVLWAIGDQVLLRSPGTEMTDTEVEEVKLRGIFVSMRVEVKNIQKLYIKLLF